jgi:hypothetical protein
MGWLDFLPHTTIRREGGVPYLTRYYILGGPRERRWLSWLPFNIFIHQFHSSDEPVLHNHPWTWARSLLLVGSYQEFRMVGAQTLHRRKLGPGNVNIIRANTFHWVELLSPEVWTLFIVGKKIQEWGFWTEEGFEGFREYLAKKPGAVGTE